MKLIFLGIGGILKSLKASLIALGSLGIFGIAVLDSAMFPIPGGADAAMITLSHLNHAMMPVYVVAAVIGSTFGCLVPYWIGLKTGEAALRKFSEERRVRVNQLVERYDFWAMLIGALLPPPFPLKIFLLTAGVFRMKVAIFLAALAVGRTVRFVLEGWMAVRYGEQATEIFKQHYPKIGLGITVLVIALFLISKMFARKQDGDLADVMQ